MVKHVASNWIELQAKLDWLADGVTIESITLEQYIKGVRDLLDSYEFMVAPNGH